MLDIKLNFDYYFYFNKNAHGYIKLTRIVRPLRRYAESYDYKN